jgi:PAS domain S-box-containing protein
MTLEREPQYAVLLLLAAALAAFIISVAWPRRSAPGAKPLIGFTICIGLWTVTYSIHWLTANASARQFWLNATYVGVVFLPVAFLAFALDYTGHGRWLTRRTLAALCVIPVMTLLVLFTDDGNGLFYGGQRTAGRIFSGGPLFWLNIVYVYSLILIALAWLLRAYRHAPRLQRRQIGTIVAGALAPLFANLIIFAGFSLFPDLDLTPLAFTVTGVFCAVGLFRFGMFDLAPIARGVLIEHMPDGMLVLDPHQRIVDVNPAACRLLDRNEAQLIGQPLPQVIAQWPQLAEPSAPIELVLSAGSVIEARLSVLTDRDGQQRGAVILLHDITARKSAEQALQQLNADLETQVLVRTAELRTEKDKSDTILRSVGQAIALTDLAFTIQYVNEAFTALTGYAADESIGQPLAAQAAWLDSTTPIDALQQGEMWHGEATGQRRDGRKYDAALTVAPVHDGRGQLIGCVISYQDISERKNLERARSRFIESISHEFRTPLANLGLYTQLLQSGAHPEKSDAYLKQITDQVQRLKLLIEDTLEIAVLDAQPPLTERRAIVPPELARDACEAFTVRARSNDVTLKAVSEADVTVWGDRGQLEQALQKVVENALTFTPHGGRITLVTRAEAQAAGVCGVIDVIDNGPGLLPDELPRVFDRFFRGKLAASGHIPGSGLGLSIARAIMHAHGGDLTVDSQPGQGCTMRLRLPART